MIRSRLLALAVALVAAHPAVAADQRNEQQQPAKVRLARRVAGGGSPLVASSIAAEHHATISTRLSAQVRSIPVEEGTRVKRGQVLVTLADDDLRAQLAASSTALASAAAYERRIAALAKEHAATPVELEAAQAQRAQAEAAVAGAKASLAYAQIRAPFEGTIQARRVTAGDLVGPGQPLLELDGSALEIQANLSEDEAKDLRVGQQLRFEAGGIGGEARVTALTPGGDPLSHRRALRARIVNAAAPLRAGTFARLQVPGAAPRDGAWVPRTALVQRGDLTGVFVVQDGRARLRWISRGESSGDEVAVRAGLGPDDQVIDAPGALGDGQLVEVVRGD